MEHYLALWPKDDLGKEVVILAGNLHLEFSKERRQKVKRLVSLWPEGLVSRLPGLWAFL